MAYGSHIDDPVMGGSSKYRSDVSITVFLNNPDEYEGGELTIETDYGSQNFKQNAGSAIIYPSSSRHEIKQVTRGERLVAIDWVQSKVRSAEQRQVLYHLHQAREQLSSEPSTKLYQQVNDSYANLVRMWAEI
jgi:PKHD-type hydroxylase